MVAYKFHLRCREPKTAARVSHFGMHFHTPADHDKLACIRLSELSLFAY